MPTRSVGVMSRLRALTRAEPILSECKGPSATAIDYGSPSLMGEIWPTIVSISKTGDLNLHRIEALSATIR